MPPKLKINQKVVVSVEDSDADFYCIELALRDCLPGIVMKRALDGEAAIELFEKAGQSSEESLPDLVLLDRNLPRKNGFEVLSYLHAHNITSKVPVVMFTSAATSADRSRALQFGARDVVLKPTNLVAFLEELRQVYEKQVPH